MEISHESEQISKKKKLIIGLDKLPIEALLNIAGNLYKATDLKALAMTNKIFGLYKQNEKKLTIVEQIARDHVLTFSPAEIEQSPFDGPKAWLNKRWLSRMREIEVYRNAADCFSLFSNNQLILKDDSAKVIRINHQEEYLPVATTSAVMYAGCHFVQFTVENNMLYIGIIPSSWDINKGGNIFNDENHCFYFTHTGHCSKYSSRRIPWRGMQRTRNGDRIGLMLDFNNSSLSVFRNGIKLGVIANDLNDKYRWVVVLHNNASVSIKTVSVEHALIETQYRETIESLRPYRLFVIRYANGALRNWQENIMQQLRQIDTPLNKEERDKYTKHVKIVIAIRTMFKHLLIIFVENPQKYKNKFRIRELNKIKATLDKVIERCTN